MNVLFRVSLTGERSESSTFDVVQDRGLSDTEGSCSQVTLKALHPGFARMTVRYSYAAEERGIDLEKEIVLGAFRPLEPIQPSTGDVVLLVPDASLQLVWTGGPHPWITQPEHHFYDLKIDGGDAVRVRGLQEAWKGTYVYQVTCAKLGEAKLTLSVGNKRSGALPEPRVSSSTVTVVCAVPDKVQLTTDAPAICPFAGKTGRVAALCHRDVRIAAAVLDNQGRRFDNVSTLDLKWTLSNDVSGALEVAKGVLIDPAENQGYVKATAASAHQVLKVSGAEGQVDVTVSLKSGYFGSITDTLPLDLVKPPQLDPPVLTVFNDPGHTGHVKIRHGSGYFVVSTRDASVARAQFHPVNQSVAIRPGRDGQTELTVRDLCLHAPPALATVKAVGVHSVGLSVADKVQKGNAITAKVTLFDQNGDVVPPHPSVNIELISLKSVVKIDAATDALSFTVVGLTVGDTRLRATCSYGQQKTVSSPYHAVHVFSPLKLDPQNITLVIGAKFQVTSIGGPESHAVEYVVQHPKTASSNGDGVVTGLTLGSTTVTGRAVSLDDQGQKAVVSEDTVQVHVVKLDGIIIQSPVRRLKVGSDLPLQALGASDPLNQNPYAFGSAQPYLSFTWSINQPHLGELYNPFSVNGVTSAGVNTAAMRLRAKKPGKISVILKVRISQNLQNPNQFQLDKDAEFKDKLDIEIVDDLRLERPSLPENNVLMAVGSKYQLKTNKNDGLSFQVLNGSAKLVTVDASGMLTAGMEPGVAVVLVKTKERNGMTHHLSLTVTVKRISFMMVNAVAAFKPKDGKDNVVVLSHLPRGIHLPLELTFHDDVGSKFDAVRSSDDVSVRPSRFDTNTFHVGNLTTQFSLELHKDQFTVLKVTKGASLQDFIVLDVKKAVSPSLPPWVAVGDVLRLESMIEGVKPSKEAGVWSAEPSDHVLVNQDDYLMVARSGASRLSYTLGKNLKTSIGLDVRPVSKLVFTKQNLVLTDAQTLQFVGVQLLPPNANDHRRNFFSGSATEKDVVLDSSHLFHCHLVMRSELEDHLDVQAGFLPRMGSHGCLVKAKKAHKFVESPVEVRLSPGPKLGSFGIEGDVLNVSFLSGFTVSDQTLEMGDRPVVMTALGLPRVMEHLRVETSNDQVLSAVIQGSSSHDGNLQRVGIKISVKRQAKLESNNLKVTVSSPLIGQRETVDIRINLVCSDRQELDPIEALVLTIIEYYWLAFLMAAAVLATFYWTKRAVTQAKGAQKVVSQPLQSQPLPLSPSSPDPANATNADGKAYLWSIDSSPVYGSPSVRRRPQRNLAVSPSPKQYSYE